MYLMLFFGLPVVWLFTSAYNLSYLGTSQQTLTFHEMYVKEKGKKNIIWPQIIEKYR